MSGEPSTCLSDKELLDWLEEQVVDVIHLDDGRVIDVAGDSVRKAIAEAARRSPPMPTDPEPEVLLEGEAYCAHCRRIVYQTGPWQDVCECGQWLSRSGYNQGEAAKRAARTPGQEVDRG